MKQTCNYNESELFEWWHKKLPIVVIIQSLLTNCIRYKVITFSGCGLKQRIIVTAKKYRYKSEPFYWYLVRRILLPGLHLWNHFWKWKKGNYERETFSCLGKWVNFVLTFLLRKKSLKMRKNLLLRSHSNNTQHFKAQRSVQNSNKAHVVWMWFKSNPLPLIFSL